MRYVLDTNALIHLLRNSVTGQYINDNLKPLAEENQPFISFATVAEILSIAKQANWRQNKLHFLAELFNELEIIAISGETSDLLMQAYVEIDSFSQGQNSMITLPQGISARNMGKNDIWIAATAYVLDATLITTDKDFLHLDSIFFNVILIPVL